MASASSNMNNEYSSPNHIPTQYSPQQQNKKFKVNANEIALTALMTAGAAMVGINNTSNASKEPIDAETEYFAQIEAVPIQTNYSPSSSLTSPFSMCSPVMPVEGFDDEMIEN
eukprot:CAMPEP_0201578434 /NCGR_PEP_ID=MMETSP0190_2-20130828/25281_1 /ASSEMBLY_ACC=CAM_ASM_000263 /TAXON_ID=37353 /ORGANISM="Rosalina sp." /LENGTH=112 /DNA_ID=CAMNT_0048011589 /DNA_START=16 /DNA_END=351 /DNA_ORIENTATION=-